MTSSTNHGPAILSFQTGNSQVTSSSFPQRETKLRTAVPNYRWLIDQGLDASSAYERSSDLLTTCKPTSISISRRCNTGPNKGKVFTARGSGFPFESGLVTDPNTYAPSNLAVPTDAENSAKVKFAAKVRSFESDWQSGAFAGEIGKTIRALRHPLESLRNGINGYLTQVKKLARRPLTYSRYSRAYGQVLKNRQREALSRALTGTYLEFKFGMTPIVYDMIDAQKAYHRLVDKSHVDMRRISASAEWDRVIGPFVHPGGSQVDVVGPDPLQDGWKTYGMCWTDKYYRVRGRVRYSGCLSADLLPGGVIPTLQLLPRDFIPTVWQLLPWSWAIDYVANVGDMLDVLSTSFGALVWCNRSTLIQIDQVLESRLLTGTYDAPSLWGSATFSGGSASSLYTSRRYSRGKFNPSAMNMVPSLMFRSPSLSQGTNLAAAFHQASLVSKVLAQRYA